MQIIDAATIQQIKQKSGLTFQHAKDYAKLSELIEKETEEYVSENTLRRLMGATPNNSEARQSTLNAIARYLGFPNWEAFYNNNHGSGFRATRKAILASELQLGQHLEIIYPVNRLLRIRLIRENTFLVEECTSTNLQPNDEVCISEVVEGQTLFVLHVYRNGKDIGQYVAGEVDGITSFRTY